VVSGVNRKNIVCCYGRKGNRENTSENDDNSSLHFECYLLSFG
jgi:hypothetical protein